MKKALLLFAVAVGLFTACDPEKETGSMSVINVTADELLNGATFKQYAAVTDEEGNITGYTEAADGNYISYDIPSVQAIEIFTRSDDGTETNLLNTSTSTFVHSGGGMFSLIPRRGSDPEQTVWFRYTNVEGESVEASKSFNVYVPADIAYELKLLCSNDYGEKVWTWDPSITGAVWGNMGYCGGAGSDVGISGNGQWWGVTSTDDFNGQLQHTEDGTNHGDGDLDAYMVLNEDGTIVSYDASGKEIRKGTFKVEGYNDSDPTAWKVGNLVTDAILWPYEINSGGNIPGNYEICYLTAGKMTLVYPDGGEFGGLGSWGEATFWHFTAKGDYNGFAAGFKDGKEWTWDPSVTGAVWGNMGYCGGAGSKVGTNGEGQWWGVTSTDEFNGQLQHTEGGANLGDGDLDAYMTFGTDGMLTSYSAAGTEIKKSLYEFKPVKDNDWKVADLVTTSILWPYEINSGGNIPGTYEVVYMTNDKMTLVYPDGGAYEGLGSWGEASFWHFKAK